MPGNRTISALLPALAALSLAACGTSGSRKAVDDGPRLYRGDETGAVETVDVDRLAPTGAGRIEEVLQGRVAGLQVIRLPGGGYSLRIRGTTSLVGDNEPLLVLDDQIIPPSAISSALASISPREVSRVEVLKDAASTAFYGSRGANGVIIITTKRGPD